MADLILATKKGVDVKVWVDGVVVRDAWMNHDAVDDVEAFAQLGVVSVHHRERCRERDESQCARGAGVSSGASEPGVKISLRHFLSGGDRNGKH